MFSFLLQRSDKITRKKIITLAIPIMINGIVQQVQILTDCAFLGHINSDFFSAVGNVFFPFFLCMGQLWVLPTGTTVLIAQSIGAGKTQNGRSIAESSLKFNSLISVLFFLIWFLFSQPILLAIGVKEPILSPALDYVNILCFLFLTMGIDVTASGIMHGVGISKPLMHIGIMRSLLNIILDWIMIYGKFGFPAMGIKGAALATVISNLAGIPVILFIVFKAGHLPFKLCFRSTFFASWKNYLPALKLSLPSSGEELLWHGGNLILVWMLNTIGKQAAGIYSLIMQIESTPVFLYIGIAKAAQTLVGNRTGEGNNTLAIQDGLQCLRYTLYLCLAFVILFIFTPAPILRIFTRDTDLINTVVPFLMIAGIYLLPKAVNITIGHGIRGYGDTRWMLFTQIFGFVFITSAAAFIMFRLKSGILGLFIAIGLDESIRAIVNFTRFFKGHKGKRPFSIDDSQIECPALTSKVP
ncbi:MAG TPA: MATE family efflux transporter [Chitinispirillaceae bacterium]|nr:MATE family efflux transporter [Chitinispirillaceae bacterium]